VARERRPAVVEAAERAVRRAREAWPVAAGLLAAAEWAALGGTAALLEPAGLVRWALATT